MKVVCLVANSISKDARVIKVAETIGVEANDVTIIGLQDNTINAPRERSDSGLQYIRLPWRSFAYNSIASLVAMFFSIAAASLIVLLLTGAISFKLLSVVFLICFCFYGIFFLPGKFRLMANTYKTKFEVHDDIHKATKLNDASVKKSAATGLLSSLKTVATRIMAGIYRTKLLVKTATELAPDVVHCNDITTLMAGVKIKQRSGAKLVYDAHEYYEGSAGLNPLQKMIFQLIHWYSSRYVDVFFVVNQSIANLYVEKYPKFPAPIIIMNATKRIESFDYDGRLHAAAGLDIAKKIILFQGGYTKHRGIESLMDSARDFPANWALVFMGWGPLEDELKRKAKEIMESNSVIDIKFLPPASQTELPMWTAGAAVGVILYEDNGINHKYCTPNKLWEFPSSKVPVLVTPRVEMKRFVDEYKFGKVIDEPVSSARIIENISTVIENSDSYIENCMIFSKANSWDIYQQEILAVYKSL
jgi:hypothetical protein